MSKWRRNPSVDKNQPKIVKDLRKMGYSVQTGMDDILVGYNGVNKWVEIKTEDKRRKDGEWKAGALKTSQVTLLKTWNGQYNVCCTVEEIIELF